MHDFGWTQLAFGSHNVESMASVERARLAAEAWEKLRFGVVCVQETHLTFFSSTAVKAALPAWQLYCAYDVAEGSSDGGGSSNSQRAGRTPAGVAIAIRKSLLRCHGGPLLVDEQSLVCSSDGRLVHLRAQWGGHRLHIASIYMPNRYSRQRTFIRERLAPLLQQQQRDGRLCVWAGDFNFVPAQRDRWAPCRRSDSSCTRDEEGVAALWQQQLGALLDMWRQRRPTAVQYTRFGRNNPPSAARLDRFYTSPQLADYVCQLFLIFHDQISVVSNNRWAAESMFRRSTSYNFEIYEA